jgi:hypothetical protein
MHGGNLSSRPTNASDKVGAQGSFIFFRGARSGNKKRPAFLGRKAGRSFVTFQNACLRNVGDAFGPGEIGRFTEEVHEVVVAGCPVIRVVDEVVEHRRRT